MAKRGRPREEGVIRKRKAHGYSSYSEATGEKVEGERITGILEHGRAMKVGINGKEAGKVELTDDSRGRLIAGIVEKVREHPEGWLFNYVKTLDSHSREPIRAFMDKPYLRYLTRLWFQEKLLMVSKSRQMMVSWLFCSLYLWQCMYHKGEMIFFVSKKEEDANSLLDRSKFILSQLPKFLIVSEFKSSYCKLEFPKIYSQIWAVSQESDALRQYTASGVFSDEMAFQPYADKCFFATRPTITGGGRYTGVSTANGKEFFYLLSYDRENENDRGVML